MCHRSASASGRCPDEAHGAPADPWRRTESAGWFPSVPKGTESEAVKLNILHILNEKYSMVEADFLSAELEAVPAYPVRE